MDTQITHSIPAAISHAQLNPPVDAPPSNKPPMVFIDKISVTFDIPEEENQKGLFQQIIEMPKILDSGWLPGTKGAYRGAVRIHPQAGAKNEAQNPLSKDYVLVQAGPRNGKGGYLRAEWNPARFSAAQTKELFGQFEHFLDLWPSKIAEAKVTRVDVAVDLPGVQIGDYLFERKKAPLRVAYFKKGRLQSLYLGKQAKAQTKIYDKAAQLGDTKAVLTRLEVSARPNCLAGELGNLKNPLGVIEAYDVEKAGLQLAAPLTGVLHHALCAEGLSGPLSEFPPLAAKKLKAQIAASPAGFWKPGTFWTGWPAAVAHAFPAFGSANCYGKG